MSVPVDARRVGEHALLLEFADNAAVHAFAAQARELLGSGLREGLCEVVPGHSTVLLVWEHGRRPARGTLIASLREAAGGARDAGDGIERGRQAVRLDTRYDGPDLEDVARTLRISPEEVIDRHTGTEYTVAFMGFAPGFPYLIAGPEAPAAAILELPRLEHPRERVPAGAVAVAAGYCGVYPRESPGGWNLIGHTGAVLFDPDATPPALLAPGMCVRFVRC